jgi:hypothetical protein
MSNRPAGSRRQVRGGSGSIGELFDRHRSDEAVSPTRQRLDEAGIRRRVPKGVTKLVDGYIQAVVKIDIGVVAPQSPPKFFPADHFTRMLEENGQDLEGLLLQAYSHSLFVKLTGNRVELEDPEAKPSTD